MIHNSYAVSVGIKIAHRHWWFIAVHEIVKYPSSKNTSLAATLSAQIDLLSTVFANPNQMIYLL